MEETITLDLFVEDLPRELIDIDTESLPGITTAGCINCLSTLSSIGACVACVSTASSYSP